MINIWQHKFELYNSSNTGETHYIIDDRYKLDEKYFLSTNNVHFKNQKCLEGITYQYIKSEKDIYDKTLLCGDGFSINNMYNEFNIIDKYLKNLHNVDIAIGGIYDNEIDLTIPYFELDGIKLKPGHLILIFGQLDKSKNDIYYVDYDYTLKLSDLLLTREKSDKSKFYIKLGTHQEKQFFLMNESIIFPISGEDKEFKEYHSYIIKNKIDYDINSTGNTASILFSNYDVARHQQDNLPNLQDIITSYSSAPSTYNILNIKYLNYEYNITEEFEFGLYTTSTGDTINKTFEITSDEITFEVDSTFFINSNINDNILIKIYDSSGTTIQTTGLELDGYINFFTTIKNKYSNKIEIDGNIPLYLYNNLYYSGYSYIIKNLHYSEIGIDNFCNYINVSPFGKVLNTTPLLPNIKITPRTDIKYFDYEFLNIDLFTSGSTTTSTAYTFETDNQYTYYNLETFIGNLFSGSTVPTNIYNENRLCDNDYYIEEIFDTSNDCTYSGCSGTWYPIQSSRYKITPKQNHIDKLNYFKPYTYIDFGILNETQEIITYNYHSGGTLMQSAVTLNTIETPYQITDSGRTMITEVNKEYMIIEKPFIDLSSSGLTGGTGTLSGITGIYDIINVSKISDISDILMKAYINRNDDYYEKKSDSERYRISGVYGQIIKDDSIIRNYATGIIYQDENDLFNFDLFNIEVDDNFNFEDINLLFKPIELIDLGIDKKIKGFW